MFTDFDAIWDLVDQGRTVAAKQAIEQALVLSPNEAELYFLSAQIAFNENNLEMGMNHCQAGLKLSGEHFPLRYLYFCLLLASRRFDDAETEITTLLALSPANADYLCGYASLKMVQLRFDEARRLCDKSLSLAPSDCLVQVVDLLVELADDKLSKSARAAHLKHLQQLMHEDRHSLGLVSVFVDSLYQQQHCELVAALLTVLLTIDPDNQRWTELSAIIDKTTSRHSNVWFGWLKRLGWPLMVVVVCLAVFNLNAA